MHNGGGGDLSAEAMHKMQSDSIKLLFTYLIAVITILGGGVMLYAIRLDPPETGSGTLSLAIVGFMGLALGFVFNRETATQATRAAQSSAAQSAGQEADRNQAIDNHPR